MQRRGGCQCGKIRYEIKAEPLSLYVCHCTECQKQSASAFGMSMPVPRNALVILEGKPKQWSRVSSSDREVACFFCGDCGTRLFHNPARNPNITNIKPGTLDDTSWLKPVANLWTHSAQTWIQCSEEMMNYEGQPTPAEFLRMAEKFSETTISPERIKELKSIADAGIDLSDIPELDKNFWDKAKLIQPASRTTTNKLKTEESG